MKKARKNSHRCALVKLFLAERARAEMYERIAVNALIPGMREKMEKYLSDGVGKVIRFVDPEEDTESEKDTTE